MPTPDVHHALRADLDALEETLGRAFAADPMTAWMYPDPATQPAFTRQFMRALIDLGFPHGHTYGAGANHAVAIWLPPDVDLFDDAAIAVLGELLNTQQPERMDELGTGLMKVGAAHPHDRSHWYLSTLGTDPARQSSGLGSALMADVLARCDRDGIGAYLESSNIRNVPFYERHGFSVLDEIHVGGDFVARPMWRDPRG